MRAENAPPVTLTDADLNEVDRVVLEYLATEGRATPAILTEVVGEQRDSGDNRSYVNRRLGRLAEHGHLRNVREKGLYELVDDPRTDGDHEG